MKSERRLPALPNEPNATVQSNFDRLERRSQRRAIRAIKSLPFNSNFYRNAQEEGLSAEHVLERAGEYQLVGTNWFRNAESIDAAFRWLITLGILRREVDGQGLTSRVRVTPLGRQLLTSSQDLPHQRANPLDRLRNWLRRLWSWQ